MAKRYFWLKLKDDFFNNKLIKKLRKIAGGDTYTIIYLKMQLLSLKESGVIKFDGTEKTLAEQLALELDEDEDNVKITLSFLASNNLMEQYEDEYLLKQAAENIGSEAESAARMRKLREKSKQKALPNSAKTSHSDADVTESDVDVQNCDKNVTLEIRDKRKEKEKEKDIDKRTPLYPPTGETDTKKSSEGLTVVENDVKKARVTREHPKTLDFIERFNEFWEAYPKKVGKTAVRKKYLALKPSKKLHDAVMQGLENYKNSERWNKDNGAYILNPLTFINERRWEDEIAPMQTKSSLQQQIDLMKNW